ncbi:MAG: polysaccharide pyruvyl transferase family protein [Candidatus Muiribacteriota bacterium]
MKKALYGYFGYNNLGDELILKKAREIFPEALVFTRRPESSGEYKRFDFYTLFLKTDKLIFPGGNIFQNKSSNLSFVYYALLVLFYKACFKKVYLLNQGIGPVNGLFFKLLLKAVIKSVDLISLRTKKDYKSYKFNQKKIRIGADTVFAKTEASSAIDIKRRRGVILKTEYFRDYNIIPDEFDLIAFSEKDFINLKKNVKNKNIIKAYNMNEKELATFFLKFSTIITMPFHGAVLSYLYGVKKIYILPYDEKVVNFFCEIKKESRLISDLKQFNKKRPFINNGKKIKKFSELALKGLKYRGC